MLASKPIARFVAVLLALAAGHGCSSERSQYPETTDNYAATQPQPQPQPTTDLGVGMAAPAAGTTQPREEKPAEPPAPAMTDEQILGIIEAANNKAIEESKAVEAKLKNKDAKAFARMMVAHHGEAKSKQTKLQQKLGSSPAASEQGQQLVEDTKKTVDELLWRSTSTSCLSRRWSRTAILELLDTKLLPDVKNAELKTMLGDPTIEKHLQEAEALRTVTTEPGAAPGKFRGAQPGTKPPGTLPGKPGSSP
jgi:putative membrane protein